MRSPFPIVRKYKIIQIYLLNFANRRVICKHLLTDVKVTLVIHSLLIRHQISMMVDYATSIITTTLNLSL